MFFLPLSLPPPPILPKTNNKMKENEKKQAGEKTTKACSVPKCYIIIGFLEKTPSVMLPPAAGSFRAPWATQPTFGCPGLGHSNILQ